MKSNIKTFPSCGKLSIDGNSCVYSQFSSILSITESEYIDKYSFNSEIDVALLLLTTLKISLYKYTQSERITIAQFINSTDSNSLNITETKVEDSETIANLIKNIKKDNNKERLGDDGNPTDIEELDIVYNFERDLSNLDLTLQFKLLININKIENKYKVVIYFDREFYSLPFIERFSRSFTQLLSRLPSLTDTKISNITIINTDEEEKVLHYFNDTDVHYDKECLIQDSIEENMVRWPTKIAIYDEKRNYTYNQIRTFSNQIGSLLKKSDSNNKFVAIIMERRVELIPSLLGILKAGMAYIPIEPSQPNSRVKAILESLNIDTLITSSNQFEKINELNEIYPNLNTVVCIDNAQKPSFKKNILNKEDIALESTNDIPKSNLSSDLAYVIFTSGTTGVPKGVAVNHRSVVNLIDWVNKSFKIDSSDKLLFVTSISFDLSVYDIFGILSAGGSIRLADDEEQKEPNTLLNIIRNEDITFWDSAPSSFQLLISHLSQESNSELYEKLRLIFLSGDWIPLSIHSDIKNKFINAQLISLGGATEATVWSNYFPVTEIKKDWVSIPYGKPIQNAKYYVLNKNLSPCPIGIPGHLYIGGDCVTVGYITDPALSKQKFIKNPFIPNTTMYATGDIAKWMEDGNIEFLGRADNQVKIRGFRIELAEIEKKVAEIQEVEQIVVIAQSDGQNEKQLCAYYVTSSHIEESQIKSFLKDSLPYYMIPSFFIKLTKMPITINGKLDRTLLPNIKAIKAKRVINIDLPKGDIEKIIADIIESVLEIDNAGIYENFFEIGGTSLSLAKVNRLLNKKFNIKIPMKVLFRYPTISDFTRYIKDSTKPNQEKIEPLELDESSEMLEDSIHLFHDSNS